MSALISARNAITGNFHKITFKRSFTAFAVSSAIALGTLGLSGCQSSAPMFDELTGELAESGFLTDPSLLQGVPGESGKRFYEKQGVDWSQYHSVMIEGVNINDVSDESNGMSRRDRLMMGIYFQNSMRMSVQKKYVVTNRPDTGVLIIRASISDATSGSTLGAAIGGGYGNVVIEGEIVDAMSGEPLVAIIDRQSGGFLSAYSDWDDVASAFDGWSEQLYSVLRSHMESRPSYQKSRLRRAQVATASATTAPIMNTPAVSYSSPPGYISPGYSSSNYVATSRAAPIDVRKQISSAASQYEQQQYAQIIDEQLIAAAGDLKADRLTAPPGRNAMERYNQVLDMDPDNDHAQDGLNIIASRYLGWAETALTNGEKNKSRMYLSRARNVNSSSVSIRHSIVEVEEKLDAPLLTAEAQHMVQTINKQPSAAGTGSATSKPQRVASVSPAAVKTSTITSTSKPVVKTAAKPVVQKPDSARRPVNVAKAATPQPTSEHVTRQSLATSGQVIQVEQVAARAAVPVAPKKVAAFDPWKGANMGNAQLNSSKLRPFVLGLSTNGDMAKIVTATKKRLSQAGFEIVGEYSPYNKATIIIATSTAMKSQAARSEFGGYGAAIRIAVTQAAGTVQISYTNPYYTQNIYRMKSDASAVANKLAQTLGHQKVYGSDKGIAANDLRDWHYMFGMPYFDDQITLQKGSSYDALVKTIDNNLSSGKNGTKKVYRIDIPGKDETVFGVAISKGAGADRTVMGNIDIANIKHSAHLPYEILVSGKKAYMLNGKFRIAISFPDLTMGQFMGISSAPDSTEQTMKSIVAPGAQLSSN